jgi:PII-like signaling protein
MIPDEASLLRVYINGNDRWQGKPLYRAVVETAREMHLAGASVFLVDLSYGGHRRLHDAKSEYLFVEIPVVVEIVDAPEHIEPLVDRLRVMVSDAFATLEPARVVHYAHHENRPEPGAPGNPAPLGPNPASAEDDRNSDRGIAMPLEGKAQRVTVYIGSSDIWHGRNLAMAIVERCRKMGIAGARRAWA